jgi:DoxX-like protein
MEHRVSNQRAWAGRILTALAVLFLLFDSVIKLMAIPPVVEGLGRLGYPVHLAQGIGILELACVIIYLVRPVAVPGAVLLTGFLGGAVATHVRIGDPLFSHILFPTYVAALLWAGLFLRDDRLRTLFAHKEAQQ